MCPENICRAVSFRSKEYPLRVCRQGSVVVHGRVCQKRFGAAAVGIRDKNVCILRAKIGKGYLVEWLNVCSLFPAEQLKTNPGSKGKAMSMTSLLNAPVCPASPGWWPMKTSGPAVVEVNKPASADVFVFSVSPIWYLLNISVGG